VAQKDDPFDYAKRLIDSLGWASSAISRMPSDEPIKTTPQQTEAEIINSLSDRTLSLKLASEDFRCAAQSLEDYQQSKNKGISTSAKAASAAYTALMGYNQEMVEENLRVLEGWSRVRRGTSPSAPSMATSVKFLTDIGVKIDDAWQGLLYALPPAEWALVEMPAKEGTPPSTLRIRSDQKKTLLSAVESGFPKTKQACEEHPKYLEAAACLLHDFLSQEWKTLDSK